MKRRGFLSTLACVAPLPFAACAGTGGNRDGWVDAEARFAPERLLLVGVALDAPGLEAYGKRLAHALEESGLHARPLAADGAATELTRETVIDVGRRMDADAVLVTRLRAIDTHAVTLDGESPGGAAGNLGEALSQPPPDASGAAALGMELEAELSTELFRFGDGRLVWFAIVRTPAARSGEAVTESAVRRVLASLRRDGVVPGAS